MSLQAAIEANRRRQARYRRAEQVLRSVRRQIFDFEDQGRLEKAQRVIATCKRILAPLWAAHAERQEHRIGQRLLYRDA